MKNNINIPKFLHDILGEKSNWLDIIMIQLIAIISVMVAWILSHNLILETWKIIIILVLAYDIGGGVIANFSSSTNLYYQKSNKKRNIFLGIHMLQPLLLGIVFYDSWLLIFTFSAYTLIASFIVNAIQAFNYQLTLSISFTLMGLLFLFLFSQNINNVLLLLMVLFIIKLPLAFSVRWFQKR